MINVIGRSGDPIRRLVRSTYVIVPNTKSYPVPEPVLHIPQFKHYDKVCTASGINKLLPKHGTMLSMVVGPTGNF